MNVVNEIMTYQVKKWNDIADMLGTTPTNKEIEQLKVAELNSICACYDIYVPGTKLKEKVRYICETLHIKEEYFRKAFERKHYSALKSSEF